MRNKAAERAAEEVGEPLAPHLSRIQASWHKMLKRCDRCNRYAPLLSELHLAEMCASHASAGSKVTEEQGQELARRGVPAECAGVAILLYVESCLPYLVSDDSRRGAVRSLQTLLSRVRLYQFFLLSGYARQSALDMQALGGRVDAAELRYRESSVKLGDAYEKERRRLARDLHDEIGHDLIVLKLYTQIIAIDLKKNDLVQVRSKLKESVSLIKRVLGSVRNLVFDLGPAVWNEQGFIPAVRTHARQFSARTGIKVHFETRRLRVPLPVRYESALYKVIQGALANIAAHAGSSHVKISLAISRAWVVMKIEDDGKGFNVESRMRTFAQSYGLRAMRDRIELLGGKIQFTSRPAQPGVERSGTTIQCDLPLTNTEAG